MIFNCVLEAEQAHSWGLGNGASSSPCRRKRARSLPHKERAHSMAPLPLAWPSVCFLKEYWLRENEPMPRLITEDALGGPISFKSALQSR